MENRDELLISCIKGYKSSYLKEKYKDIINEFNEEEKERLERAVSERIGLLPTEDYILVKSYKDSEVKKYKIYHYDDNQTCSCTDYHMRKVSCKHLWKYRLLYKEDILPKSSVDMRSWTIDELNKDIDYMKKYGSEYSTDRFKKLRTKCKEKDRLELFFDEINEERGEIYYQHRN